MSNLRLIDDTTSSGVASVNITDVFSSDFDIYKIVATGYQATSGTSNRARLRFINNTGITVLYNTPFTGKYDHCSLAMESFATGVYPEVKETSVTYIDFVLFDNGQAGAESNGVWYVFNPYSSSSYTFINFQETHYQSGHGASTEKGTGVLKQLSSIGGFQVYNSGGASFDLRLKTYGLRVDS